ncbi:MAG: hypothetical protein AAFR13_00160 [Pseudomonadota bacterium]
MKPQHVPNVDPFDYAQERYQEGREVLLAFVIRASGSLEIGTVCAVCDDGNTAGDAAFAAIIMQAAADHVAAVIDTGDPVETQIGEAIVFLDRIG